MLIGSVVAQETRDGEIGPSSQGLMTVSLEIINSPQSTITIINPGGGNSSIPAFVSERLIEALGNNNNANFPVCLAVPGNYEATVTVTSTEEEQFLVADDGSKIPFTLKLNGNSGQTGNNGNGQSARYKPSDELSCNEDTGLDVEINIGDVVPGNANNARGNNGRANTSNAGNNINSYKGSFKLLIRIE